MDNTSHNLEVTEGVCKIFEVDNIPGKRPCNIQPFMMLQGKIKELYQETHNSLGKRRIDECFLVDVEFRNKTLVIKSLKCLSNFISRDYSAIGSMKSRIHYSHFSSFIHPKENYSLLLKDHWFNRINDCALAILYHVDDITNYLNQFSNEINGITILDCGFLETEVLKPIYVAISLVGSCILISFHNLILVKDTAYSAGESLTIQELFWNYVILMTKNLTSYDKFKITIQMRNKVLAL